MLGLGCFSLQRAKNVCHAGPSLVPCRSRRGWGSNFFASLPLQLEQLASHGRSQLVMTGASAVCSLHAARLSCLSFVFFMNVFLQAAVKLQCGCPATVDVRIAVLAASQPPTPKCRRSRSKPCSRKKQCCKQRETVRNLDAPRNADCRVLARRFDPQGAYNNMSQLDRPNPKISTVRQRSGKKKSRSTRSEPRCCFPMTSRAASSLRRLKLH